MESNSILICFFTLLACVYLKFPSLHNEIIVMTKLSSGCVVHACCMPLSCPQMEIEGSCCWVALKALIFMWPNRFMADKNRLGLHLHLPRPVDMNFSQHLQLLHLSEPPYAQAFAYNMAKTQLPNKLHSATANFVAFLQTLTRCAHTVKLHYRQINVEAFSR